MPELCQKTASYMMFKAGLDYSLPVLRKGKEVKSWSKGSSKANEVAKQPWLIEYFFVNPITKKKERFRITQNLNRIKDPAQKLKLFTELLQEYTALLETGLYSPFEENSELNYSITDITLSEAKAEFIAYHKSKNSRPRTITSFSSKVKMMVEYFGETKKVRSVTTIDLTKMMIKLEADKQWVGKTFMVTRVALVNFFNFLKNTGRIKVNPFDGFNEKRKVLKSESHRLFTDDDFNNILEWLSANDTYTLFCVNAIYYTCIRPAELRFLQVKNIDLVRRQMTIPGTISKNKKTETLSLDEDFVMELEKLRLQEKPGDFYLTGSVADIVGENPQPEKMVYKRLQRCFKALNFLDKGYTLYSSKHLSNVRKRRAGWLIEEIQIANRHSSPAQTEIYLRDLMKDVKIGKKVPTIKVEKKIPSISLIS
jgi:integrase